MSDDDLESSISAAVLPSHFKESWLASGKNFTHPIWSEITLALEHGQDECELQKLYEHLGRLWMRCLQAELADGYEVRESANFFLLSKASDAKANEAMRFLEHCLFRIRSGLPFLPANLGYGKWPVLCLADDEFYRYLSDFDSGTEGKFASVGGVFLNKGYGHFALPSEDLHLYSQVLAHELSHAVMAILQLPAWLDEAITMGIEERLASGAPYFLDRELVRRHQEYWRVEIIQEFWAGTSFWFPDDGQELSYHLARFLFRALYQGGTADPNQVRMFISMAERTDAGYNSALEHLGIDLGEVLSNLLGEGDWKPDPVAIKSIMARNVDGTATSAEQ